MNLADLNKIDIKDLKNIDFEKVKAGLKKQPDILVLIIGPLITFFVCVNIFTAGEKNVQNLQAEITLIKEKVKAVKDRESISTELNDFINHIPARISETTLVNYVTDTAIAHKVQIENLSQPQISQKDLYETIVVGLSISISDYRDLWLFIHAIEESPYLLKIDYFSSSLSAERGTRGTANDANSISTELRISAVNYLTDDKKNKN